MTKPAPARATLATLALTCGIACAAAAATQAVPLTAARWQTVGKAEFVPTEGFPDGLLKLGDATADLKGLSFGDGTIEYDAKLLDAGFASFRFRTQGPDSAELFYLRDDGNCPAADDCIQYVPMIHGVWPWEMYPEYQTHAAITVGAWNHVKLVISGRRMNVFINGAVEPTLAVGRLEAAPLHGGLQFSGPAEFANLTVSPGITHSLPSQPDKDPTDADPNLVRRWAVATTTSPLAYGAAPSLAQMPADPAAWASLPTERHGLVNLSRRFGSPTDPSTGSLAWLKTSIRSDRDRSVHVSVGVLHEAWIYANGKLVFAAENLYYPEAKRLAPDGRISLRNAAFDLPLHKGRNEVAVALDNILAVGHLHYGWGIEMRLDDLDGLTLRPG